MAGVPCLMVEIEDKVSTQIYVGTHNYVTRSTDTPASEFFEARLLNDVEFDRKAGTFFWGQRSRGSQNFGVIELANADGAFDSYVGSASLRDFSLTIKRGETLDAYDTFTTVATLVIDRVDFTDEHVMRIYVKDLSAKLERALQTSLYPTTLSNGALRGRPRPLSIGRCHQVALQQPNATGNGQFDVHDNDNWCGIEQLLDQGTPQIASVHYERSTVSGIYGIERLNGIGAKQLATVLGAFAIDATPVTEDFASLSAWTETNGGVAGRDATIVSNELRLQNTAGGADLILQLTTAITAAATDIYFYEFDCTQWTSGSAQFRSGSLPGQVEKLVDAVGRYTGVVRVSTNWNPRFVAINGSNCDLRIDNLRVRRVTPIQGLSALLSYLCTTKGPLSSGDLDSTAIAALESATGYELGYHASDAVQIVDVLDQVMQSHGGWWYVNRTGQLTVGRLLAPTGSPSYTFDAGNIAEGMSVEFDRAPGLSNVILAKRNWVPYGETDVVPAFNYVQLNSADKDADVTLSSQNYNYSAANVGSVRSTPFFYGDRYYVEVDPTTVDGAGQHYIGWGNSSATITSYPGATSDSQSYRADGNRYSAASPTAFGATWNASNRIGLAVDMRWQAMGCSQQHIRMYWHKDGTYQGSGNPDTEANYVTVPVGQFGWGYLMVGANVAGTNAGSVNFGQAAFTTEPPDDYIAPAWHRQLLLADYRYRFQTTTALAAAYNQATAALSRAGAADNTREYVGGVPTLITAAADARSECNRWGSLYAAERFFYTFDAFLDEVAGDQLEPGDLISVTYPRLGLSAGRLLRVTGVRGRMLERRVTITAWG